MSQRSLGEGQRELGHAVPAAARPRRRGDRGRDRLWGRGAAGRRSRRPVVGRPMRDVPFMHPRGAPASSHAWAQPPRLRRALHGAPLSGVLACGTLATHTVVHAALAIPLPDGIPLDRACLLGCGVSTGVGAAIQTAKVWPGASVAVIGLGGIGLAAMQGARIAGAERLIAIDIASTKFGWAATFGATDVVDASSVDPVQAVLDLTGGAGSISRSRRPASRHAWVRQSRCSRTPARRSRSGFRRSRARSSCSGAASNARRIPARPACSSRTVGTRSPPRISRR